MGKGTRSNEVVIVGVETVTGLGNSLDELWEALLAGKSAITAVRRFPTAGFTSQTAACVADLTSQGGRSILRQLIERLLPDTAGIPRDAFLIAATTKAGIDNLESLYRDSGSHGGDLLLHSLAGQVSEKLGLASGTVTINAACASATIALARGAAMIRAGESDAVLVCCADIISRFVFSGFSALKALSWEPCRPFDRHRKGLSLGDGAVWLLLMSRRRALREKRSSLGRLLGWGMSNDATHITAPDRTGWGLAAAIDQALTSAGCSPGEITAINAHGTGTVYNDLMEITAFKKVFGRRQVPIYSVKGAIGHTLGAAGAIEVAVGLKTLAEQIMPPTTGCRDPEPQLSGRVTREARRVCGDYLLSTNSGFGGINAALVVGR